MSEAAVHVSHPDIVRRLKRAQGHLASVIAMFEDGRPCIEIAQQLHAVESALANAKRAFIQDHIEHCLAETEERNAREAVAELKLIAKFL